LNCQKVDNAPGISSQWLCSDFNYVIVFLVQKTELIFYSNRKAATKDTPFVGLDDPPVDALPPKSHGTGIQLKLVTPEFSIRVGNSVFQKILLLTTVGGGGWLSLSE